MKKNIDTLIQDIAKDNVIYILSGGYTSIKDYIITTAESGDDWGYYFEDGEVITPNKIEEFKKYLNERYDYLPQPQSQEEFFEALKELPYGSEIPSVMYECAEEIGLYECNSMLWYEDDYWFDLDGGRIVLWQDHINHEEEFVYDGPALFYEHIDGKEFDKNGLAGVLKDLQLILGDYTTPCEGVYTFAEGEKVVDIKKGSADGYEFDEDEDCNTYFIKVF